MGLVAPGDGFWVCSGGEEGYSSLLHSMVWTMQWVALFTVRRVYVREAP